MFRYAFVIPCLVLLVGCGSGSLSDEALERASTGVQTALESWKKGGTPDKVASQVQITDPDWKAQVKLVDFTIHRTEGLQGGNARCWVTLSLRDRRGKAMQRDVVYEVNLEKSPAVVARDPMN